MKAIHIIIILILLTGIGSGIYFYQKDKQEKALAEHNQKKFEQLTEASQKSSSAGLLAIASAINKFHQLKGHYPKTLIELYPEFIPDKSFLVTLKWKYYAAKGTYLVKRHISGQQVVTSMGPDLKLKFDKPKTSPSSRKTIIAASSATKKKPGTSKKMDKTPVPMKPRTQKIVTDTSLKNNLRNAQKPIAVQKKQPPEPKFTVVKKELTKNETYLLLLNNTGFFIWKNKEGIIGFSNVRYPDEKELDIYQDKSWIVYHNNQPKQIRIK